MSTAFTLNTPPVQTTQVIFSSPHSGRAYFDTFLSSSVLTKQEIRSSEDAFVDELFAGVTQFGAPMIAAIAPRAYLDLNRSFDELDPGLIAGLRRVVSNPRVASGLGVVPRVVSGGRHIYDGKLDIREIQHRINTYWRPFHKQMQVMIDDTRQKFGSAVIVDCHSMPKDALDGFNTSRQPDIVLGDRFGASASARVADRIEAAFEDQGFRVVRNTPFAGAYIAQHYGRPTRRQHAVQIEINRALYMDEDRVERLPCFDEVRTALMAAAGEICECGSKSDVPVAAE